MVILCGQSVGLLQGEISTSESSLHILFKVVSVCYQGNPLPHPLLPLPIQLCIILVSSMVAKQQTINNFVTGQPATFCH